MADVQIDADAANIPALNVVDQVSDPTAPGSGHAKLYVKGGVLYVRLDTGDPVAVGGAVALAEGRLAVGDGSGVLSALALGTEGQLVTADASGFAAWADPPEGAGAFVGVRYSTNAGAAIASGSPAILDFEDQEYDSGGGTPLVTTGAAWKFTAPETGYYRVSVFVSFQASASWNAGERVLATITKNTVDVCQIDRWEAPTTTTLVAKIGGSTTIALSATDYISLTINQNSGANLLPTASALAAWVSIEKVG